MAFETEGERARDSTKGVLRLLQIEDSESDAALNVRLLEKAGYRVESERVNDEPSLRAALQAGAWDLLLSDYSLPAFDAPAALALLRESGLDIPFIVISGAIREEAGVEMMRAGAHDYLPKGRLARLAPAVDRELREAENRRRQRQADSDFRKAHSELAAIHAHAPNVLFVVGERLLLEKVSGAAARITGRAPASLTGETVCEAIHCLHRSGPNASLREGCAYRAACPLDRIVEEVLTTGAPSELREGWLAETQDGGKRCFLISGAPVTVGNSRRALICMQDVTQLRQAEAGLKETISKLESSLAEREVLLREIHHRVYNNLQTITSLISLQASTTADPNLVARLLDTEQRVRAMSMVYQQLYSVTNVTLVDLADYAKALALEIGSSFQTGSVDVRFEGEPVWISLEQAIPCGLILNELINNAFRYAYPRGEGGIWVRIASNETRVSMTVEDSGIGLAPGQDFDTPRTLGMMIIRTLTTQLDGELEVTRGPGVGASVTVHFERASDGRARFAGAGI